jgi:hypothetical protein
MWTLVRHREKTNTYVERPCRAFGYLWARAEVAGVGVARDEARGLKLAVASDHDRRIGSTQALWEVQRPLPHVAFSGIPSHHPFTKSLGTSEGRVF